MLVDGIIARISDTVAPLSGRVLGAREYRKMLQSSSLRATANGAYVMPAGIRGGKVTAATGLYLQGVDEVIAVVILVPDPNPLAGRQQATIDALIKGVIETLCGWSPGDTVGTFELLRGAMINLGDAALAFQLEFSLSDQLRITT